MAKKSAGVVGDESAAPGSAERRLVDFAEDLGRIFGTAEAKARTWLAERQQVLNQLNALRDKAGELIQSLGESAGAGRARGRQAAGPAPAGRKRGRRKGSKMSAEARAKIAAAQRKRWAKVRKSAE